MNTLSAKQRSTDIKPADNIKPADDLNVCVETLVRLYDKKNTACTCSLRGQPQVDVDTDIPIEEHPLVAIPDVLFDDSES